MAAPSRMSLLPADLSLSFFGDEDLSYRSKERGYSFFVSSYIHNIFLAPEDDEKVGVRARCYRSMRKNESPHTVNMIIDKKARVISASKCTCVAGLSGTCSHVIALLYTLVSYQQQGLVEVPAQPSVTSLPQQWHKPRGRKIKPDEPVTALVMAKPTTTKRKREPVYQKSTSQSIVPPNKDDIRRLKKTMPNTQLSYLLSEDCMFVDTPKGKVQRCSSLFYQLKCSPPKLSTPTTTACGNTSFPMPSQSWVLPNELSACNATCSITLEEALALEGATVKQAECPLWHAERENRVTASLFGKILKRQKECNLKFLTSLLGTKAVHSASLTYGKTHEVDAKEAYILTSKEAVHIHDCGLVVNPSFSFLGASPDAKVCCGGQTGILEVKCPYSARKLTAKDAALTLNNFYLKADGDTLSLDRSHEYYYQVQGQLLVTGAPFCDFVCYCVDTHVERILPDVEFCTQMLTKLAQFYQTHAMPFLARKKQRDTQEDLD